jgi:protein associated with RNAse G/E
MTASAAMEVYDPAGLLEQIYVNVASVPVLKNNTLEFADYELDVSLLTGQPARVVAEDEFAAAIISYGYSPEFQAHCRQVAAAALQLAQNWTAKGLDCAENV